MKIILLELNEVPHKVFAQFSDISVNKKYEFDYYITKTLDSGSLSPWSTWESVHRGVYNYDHGLIDINQPLDKADIYHPSIFDDAIKYGKTVGLANTMNSGSLASKKPTKFSFFIPEAFSTTSYCVPASLTNFQFLNLYLSRKSARIVERSIPSLRILLSGIFSFLRNISSFRSMRLVFFQIVSEVFQPWRKVRRRVIQSDLLFDIFTTQIKKDLPDLSVFFTNHVASSMHRFWEALYPEDYPQQIADDEWLNKYKHEIPNAMRSTNHYINILTNLVDKRDDTQLWIVSGLGQEAVPFHCPLNYFWHVADLQKYIFSYA